jgi:hypothetical protein
MGLLERKFKYNVKNILTLREGTLIMLLCSGQFPSRLGQKSLQGITLAPALNGLPASLRAPGPPFPGACAKIERSFNPLWKK